MSIEQCYEKIRGLATNFDTFQVVREVERCRQLWKPDKVRVVLLAESHVRTSPKDFVHSWAYPNANPVYAGKFVRFVYCLAHGERDLVNIASNNGTWQFWKLLFSCLNRTSGKEDFAPILKGPTPDFVMRMRNKIQLLGDLKEAGIWLVDASIAGINGLDQKTKDRIIELCWQDYLAPIMRSLSPSLKRVMIIGEGVKRILLRDLQVLDLSCHTIPQPQAQLRGGYDKYFREAYEFCAQSHLPACCVTSHD
jgi:hypothetical protein